MDLISRYSPSASVSPPISPIKLFNQPSSTNSLPPLKNLPVWNRPGLEKNRFIRSIAKDSPECDKTEFLLGKVTSKGTQTSPPGTALTKSQLKASAAGKDKQMFGEETGDNPVLIAEKRLFFVQSEHDHVLQKLHSEIEKLKKEKKELNFKFVMTRNGISISPDHKDDPLNKSRIGSTKMLKKNSDARNGSAAKQNDRRRNSSAKDGVKNTRTRFKSGGLRNPVLENKPLLRMKSGSKSAKFNVTERSKKAPMDVQQTDVSANQSATRDMVSSAVSSSNDVEYSPEDYEAIIRGLQRMNAKQASELNHLRVKLVEKQGKQGQEEAPVHPENRLPRLAMHSSSKSGKMPPVLGEKHEIVTLPALRPQKLGNRQRKTQAAHTQRQRFNKEFMQKYA